MAKYKRMINCEFVNASSFKSRISNKGKLLYLYFCFNADDYGFVANAYDLITLLDANDSDFHSQASCDLIENNYKTAVDELIDKGMIFKIRDNYDNDIYLVRHWFMHNTIPSSRITPSNYEKYLDDYAFTNENVYILKGQCNTSALQMLNKCNTDVMQLSAQSKVNKSKVKYSKVNESNINTNNIYINNKSDVETPSHNKNDDDIVWNAENVSRALRLMATDEKELTDDEKEFVKKFKESNDRKKDEELF